jgi:hypothetical protein
VDVTLEVAPRSVHSFLGFTQTRVAAKAIEESAAALAAAYDTSQVGVHP